MSFVTNILRRWAFAFGVLCLTCFGVFVLPFLLPPPIIEGVSAANAAGFNNKVAALAAATLSLIVFFKELRWPSSKVNEDWDGDGPLPLSVVWAPAIVCGAIIAVLGRLIILSHARYISDAGYFIEQIGSNADYGRKLYDQIEFPYGPLLFYIPIFLRTIFSPFHLSLAGAYFTTLVLEQVAGLLMVGYIIKNLPMRRIWKIVALILCMPVAIELSFGLNHTFFRFAVAPAFLVLIARCSKPWAAWLCLFIGQTIVLSVSPEMGFAFAVAGTAYAVTRFLTEGKAWLVPVATPLVATLLFLVAAGGGYLRMLKLFSHGLYNLIVEPLPHILIFLFALVWLVPMVLASFLRRRRPEALMLGALYVFALVLLPVAFGRADPGHVLFNGFVLFFLSMVGVSTWKPMPQILWISCVSFVFLWTAYIDTRPSELDFRGVIHYDVLHYGSDGIKRAAFKFTKTFSPSAAEHYFSVVYDADQPFDMKELQSVVGASKVATPDLVPMRVEESLKQSGQYTPSFYCFRTAVLDTASEQHEIEEMNSSTWALIPNGVSRTSETPTSTGVYLGFTLPYQLKHRPYVSGLCFDDNLRANWRPIAKVGEYQIYRRNDVLARNSDHLCFINR
jgi:hypothetical protein